MIPGWSIIIPAYNEGAVIGRVLGEFGRPAGCHEIIVVDDGSTDNTAEAARSAGARVISHRHNKGYGAALKTGIEAAASEFVVCCDGDGQHRIDDVLTVANAAMNGPQFDMVVGVRGRDSRQDWLRRPGKAILCWFANLLTHRRIPDLNSGLRAFRAETIRKYLHLMPSGFSFSTTSSIAMLRMGYNVEYVPIRVVQRTGRKSTVKFFEDGFRVFMLIVNLTVLFNPMRVFLPLAAMFVGASLAYFVLYSVYVRVHITESMVLLFVTGFLMFCLGIICEQISAIRREMHT